MLIRDVYSLCDNGRGTRPRVALSPTRPQNEAGMRGDPPPSEDMLIGRSPAGTAAAEPPEEAPAGRASLQGLRVIFSPPRAAGGATPPAVLRKCVASEFSRARNIGEARGILRAPLPPSRCPAVRDRHRRISPRPSADARAGRRPALRFVA